MCFKRLQKKFFFLSFFLKKFCSQFYSKYLARRLIYGTSVSDDSEAGVLSNLKQACGFE